MRATFPAKILFLNGDSGNSSASTISAESCNSLVGGVKKDQAKRNQNIQRMPGPLKYWRSLLVQPCLRHSSDKLHTTFHLLIPAYYGNVFRIYALRMSACGKLMPSRPRLIYHCYVRVIFVAIQASIRGQISMRLRNNTGL